MRLALALLLLPCAVYSQFFGNQQNPQSQQQQQNQHIPWVGPQRDSPGLHPSQYQSASVLNQPYAQRTGQQNAGGIMRSNSAIVPNSQTNQHPIFDLMRNQHMSQPRQTNPNMYQNQAQQPQAQPNQFMQNQNSQFNPNTQQQQNSFQSQQNQQNPFQNQQNQQNPFQNQQNQQNPFQNQQNQQRQQQVDPRPRAFNRLSNRVDQWTGSSGVNSPGIFTAPNRGGSALNPGATFYIQLSSYVNERLAMKGGTTCYCAREVCTLIENILHPCYFAFTVVIGSSSGEPVHYISKQFVAVNSSGAPNPADGDWTVPVTLQLVSKPTYIDIFVNNLGPVIQGQTVNYLDEFWQVDTFTLDLTDYQPSVANQQPTPVSTRINGQLVGSNLELSYYVQCQSGLFGENCDLTCRPTKQQNPPRSICTSRVTNSSSVCATNNTQGQVQNCQPCGYGVVNDECADLANYNGRELGVNSAFRVWTIVLAVLLAIAIIFILILVFMYVLAERKLKREHAQDLRDRDQQTNGNGNGNGHNGIGAYEDGRHAVSNPLLANEWDKPSHPPFAFAHHGIESESNHSGSAPPRSGIPTTSAFQPPRREAQV